MTTSLKAGESCRIEIQHSNQYIGLALFFKKYFWGIIKNLNKVISKQTLLLEKRGRLADTTSFQRTAIILLALRIGLFDY
ncbi:hypothetical protein [Coleofasciculus sp. FACHB-1120]|uniref:hypothetical protein n=1 Tax=Coleofasciculus sp. FACHB-1120 TaxID=2692783 RepID=UPI0016886C67|nr:hypothetical protein [Coleofasciculus sp. FACHB-1120]MBD2741381.1 hypothetical protein [Coleofasciculus sp. FACHB-1120]